jgi:hypothetical protein
MELVYPDYTRHDKRARHYRYLYDADYKKFHWNDLDLKERDYWRGRVQQDEQDRIRKHEPGRFKKKKAQGPTQSRIKEKKEQEAGPPRASR